MDRKCLDSTGMQGCRYREHRWGGYVIQELNENRIPERLYVQCQS